MSIVYPTGLAVVCAEIFCAAPNITQFKLWFNGYDRTADIYKIGRIPFKRAPRFGTESPKIAFNVIGVYAVIAENIVQIGMNPEMTGCQIDKPVRIILNLGCIQTSHRRFGMTAGI